MIQYHHFDQQLPPILHQKGHREHQLSLWIRKSFYYLLVRQLLLFLHPPHWRVLEPLKALHHRKHRYNLQPRYSSFKYYGDCVPLISSFLQLQRAHWLRSLTLLRPHGLPSHDCAQTLSTPRLQHDFLLQAELLVSPFSTASFLLQVFAPSQVPHQQQQLRPLLSSYLVPSCALIISSYCQYLAHHSLQVTLMLP